VEIALWILDVKANRNDVKKRPIAFDVSRPHKVIPHMKNQFVCGDPQGHAA
jgi:hypothetical protein